MTIEKGLSDFHKMSLDIIKVFYKRQPPNIVTYRNYKNFNDEVFVNDLNNYFTEKAEFLSFNSFNRTIDKALEKFTPLKKRYVRANQAPFMIKT